MSIIVFVYGNLVSDEEFFNKPNVSSRMKYSRTNPSWRFRELEKQYALAHSEETSKPSGNFGGGSLYPHIEKVRKLIEITNSKSVLDYGCGKASLYLEKFSFDSSEQPSSIERYWNIESITLFDPGVPQFAKQPTGDFDGLISTDVLEHIPEEDIDWVLEECFGYAKRFVYMNIASYPAIKVLPNGWNAHITIQPREWWEEKILKASAGWEGSVFLFDISSKRRGLVFNLCRHFGMKKINIESIHWKK